MSGPDGDNSSFQDLGQIKEANVSDGDNVGLGLLGLSQSIVPGTDGDSTSGWDLSQIQEVILLEVDKVGPP